jgi:hypothetical protein
VAILLIQPNLKLGFPVTGRKELYEYRREEINGRYDNGGLVYDLSVIKDVPSLTEFLRQVNPSGSGPHGLWAEELFGFKVESSCWGCVPNANHTASYAVYMGSYHGFFIHDYLGGSHLYAVPPGTEIAIIYSDSLEWYVVNGGAWLQTTPSQGYCEYSGAGPWWFWGDDGSDPIQTIEILNRYYRMDIFAIQTSVCTGEGVGILVLNGSWIRSEPYLTHANTTDLSRNYVTEMINIVY